MENTPLKQPPSTLSKKEFLALYGGIYEHSQWIAEGAWSMKQGSNLDTAAGLHGAMKTVVDTADDEAKLKLICAHPDLAGKAAVRGDLTEESKSEQTGAGLDRCSPREFEEFQALNKTYKNKFGFPFIIAVKGLDRTDILDAFKRRATHDRDTEFKSALNQIHRIAGFRLLDLT